MRPPLRASLLAMDAWTTRFVCCPALSLTTIASRLAPTRVKRRMLWCAPSVPVCHTQHVRVISPLAPGALHPGDHRRCRHRRHPGHAPHRTPVHGRRRRPGQSAIGAVRHVAAYPDRALPCPALRSGIGPAITRSTQWPGKPRATGRAEPQAGKNQRRRRVLDPGIA